jgi:phosphoadenosine phosphosulfate reductase
MITVNARSKDEETVESQAELEGRTAEERIRWALEQWGDQLVLSTSFGIQSAVMLHLATRVRADIPVIWVDTGYLFAETYHFAEALKERLSLNLHVFTPLMSAARQEATHGKRWEQGLEGLTAYNLDNKVEPMNRAIKELGATAWLSGLRRVQAKSRSKLPVVQRQNRGLAQHEAP